jgi:5-methylcytosine-specific restriction endonuclease McrA
MTAATALRTLVLNADFRPLNTYPLSIVSAQDAIVAVYRDRAAVVEEWDAVFRSPSCEIKIPKVIALRDYAHISAVPKFCRRSILLRDRFRCQYCGEQFQAQDLTFDHVVPRAKGGLTEWTNILSACIPCNGLKRDSHANYSGRKGAGVLRPLKAPRQPTSSELLRSGLEFLDPAIRADFSSYLYWNAELRA